MCSCDSSDGPDAWQETTRKARKPHRCYECRKTIQPGEVYSYVSGIWEAPDSFHFCLGCRLLSRAHDIAERVLDPQSECFAPYGQLRSTIRECAREEGAAYAWALQQAVRKLRAERRAA